MMKLAVLFALVACSVASPKVTSYAFTELAPMSSAMMGSPMMKYMGHQLYNSFPFMSESTFVPHMAKMSPYMSHENQFMSKMIPHMSSMVTPYTMAPMMKMMTPMNIMYQGHELGQMHIAQDPAGNKVGFSHMLPDSSIAKTDYLADSMGYKMSSLPMAHTPAPVSDTIEVMAAKAAHFAEVEKAKMRNKRDITYLRYPHSTHTPINSYSYPHISNYAINPYTIGTHQYNYHF